MKKETMKIANGVSGHSGIKEIAFKKISDKPLDFEIQPVLFGVFTGDWSVQTTYQQMEEGDYILGIRWRYYRSNIPGKSHEQDFFIRCVNSNKSMLQNLLSEEESLIIWDTIEQKYPWIIDFFLPVLTSNTHLPIPEEEWLSTIHKQKALDDFEEKFGCICDHFDLRNKKEDLRYKPKKLDFDIKTYIPSFFHNPREYKSTYKEEWYVSRGNGRKDLNNTIKISPKFNSAANFKDYLERTDLERSLSAYIPEELIKHQGYKFLIKIHRGVHYNDKKGIYYGNSIDVWYL